MRIISSGIDLIEISRIRSLYERYRERFVERVYTPEERRRLAALRDPAPYLAGRWAVKEAVLKVLGTGLSGGIGWQDINVLRDPAGAPIVQLQGKAGERARAIGIERILVSISHSRDLAIAQALGIAEA
ncbi:MAG: holo-ACP synthase [Planctomycetes bacterium]|nr:holo-ACP synthase [Planctomycetota bacterium]